MKKTKFILILFLFSLNISCAQPLHNGQDVKGGLLFKVDFPGTSLKTKQTYINFEDVLKDCDGKHIEYDNGFFNCINTGDLEVSIK